MKNRSFVVAAVCISAAVFLFMTVEAFARIGGSRSIGSRGSRSMSTPTRSYPSSTPSSTATSLRSRHPRPRPRGRRRPRFPRPRRAGSCAA